MDFGIIPVAQPSGCALTISTEYSQLSSIADCAPILGRHYGLWHRHQPGHLSGTAFRLCSYDLD